MNFNQLRVFHSVAQEGSVTAAARRLAVSQPAVSKLLGELEGAVGAELFDRLPRGMALTSAGQVLLAHAERIFASELAAERELAEHLGLERGRLRVAASTTIGSYLVPQVFGRFRVDHPGIELSLEIGNASQVEAAVLDERVELGLSEGFVESRELDVEVFDHDEVVAIATPGSPLLACSPLTPAALLEQPFLTREPGSGTRAVIEAALAELGLTVEPVMSLGSNEAIKSAVAAGLGVAMVSRLAVELELEVGHLSEIPVKGLTVRRALHQVSPRGRALGPAAVEFTRLLGQPRTRLERSSYRI